MGDVFTACRDAVSHLLSTATVALLSAMADTISEIFTVYSSAGVEATL